MKAMMGMVTVRMSLEDFHPISWAERALGVTNWFLPWTSWGRFVPFLPRFFLFSPFKTIYPYGIFMLALVALVVCLVLLLLVIT